MGATTATWFIGEGPVDQANRQDSIERPRMTRSKASLLLFALTGCLHRSPDAAVLAPLVPYFTEEHNDQINQPEYIVFADQLTATVFESLRRNAHYRITPMGTRLVCPSNPAPWPHCYALGARVIVLIGDSAIASIERTSSIFDSGPRQAVLGATRVYSDNFLLRRRSGKWRVEKRLDGSVTIPL
jgi:hypothetical protein